MTEMLSYHMRNMGFCFLSEQRMCRDKEVPSDLGGEPRNFWDDVMDVPLIYMIESVCPATWYEA